MTKLSKRGMAVEDAATTISRLARVLATRCDVTDEELAARAAVGLAAWASERKPVGLRNLMVELARWSRYWIEASAGEVDPLAEEGLVRYAVHVRSFGLSNASVLNYLTAIKVMCQTIGLVSPEQRVLFRKVGSLYTLREHRRQPLKARPILFAEMQRLVARADPAHPRDVREIVIVLILYEAMATFHELLGSEVTEALLDEGVMIDHLRYESGGTSLLRLHPLRIGTPGRTVRLSADTTAWIRHWLAMRGPRPGHLFAFWPPEGSGDLKLAPIGATPLWRQPKQFTHMALRHGISGLHLTAASFRLGRAVALLDAGYSLTRVAELGGWSSPLRLAWALDAGLSARRSARRGAEPLRPHWPRPDFTAHSALPRQLELRLVDAA